MILTNLIIAIFYICFAVILKFFPPKNINSFWGLRISKTMESNSNWKKGHLIAGNFLFHSLPILILGHIASYCFIMPFSILVGIGLFICQMVLTIIYVNLKLNL